MTFFFLERIVYRDRRYILYILNGILRYFSIVFLCEYIIKMNEKVKTLPNIIYYIIPIPTYKTKKYSSCYVKYIFRIFNDIGLKCV